MKISVRKNLIITCLAMMFMPLISQAQTWNQLGLDIDGESALDQSGYSVSLSADGNTVAIGAPEDDGNGSNAGHTRIYEWDGSAWNQLGNDIDGEAAGDQSGWSVSLSANGSTVAIGAVGNDGNGSNSGHTRIYQWDGSAWNQQGGDIDGELTNDESGFAVSLNTDGTIVAIGAVENNGNGNDSGHTRIYQWDGSAWNQLGGDIDGDGANEQSGRSVSLSANGFTVAIGAPFNSGNGFASGHTRIYQWDGSAWNQLGGDIDGEAAGDQSGYSVDISANGSTVAIGAPFNGLNAGHTRIYQWDGSAWSQVGGDIDSEANFDRSGWSISLSSDGSTVAIGANENNGNGSNSGHTRIYQWDGSAWNQLGGDIDGEGANEQSGWSVSLSADATTVAIGATLNDANGNNSGHTRVYRLQLPGNIWTGATSTDWNTASNWSQGNVPVSSDTIVIPDVSGASGNFPITASDITVEDLTVEAGASLTIGAGNGLIIGANGTVTNNGTVTLEADITGSAWLDDFTNATTSYSGDITVQLYVNNASGLGQQMFGSPVNNGIVQGLDQTYATASNGQQIIMSNCASAQVDLGSPYSNLFEWREDAILLNGCEYEAWFTKNQNTALENLRAYSGWMNDGTILSFTGVPNLGDVTSTFNLTAGSTGIPNKDGWNIISNPYPSAWVFPASGLGVLNAQTYSSNQTFGGSFQPILPGQALSPGQGYVVNTSALGNPSTALSVSSSERVQGNSNFKSSNDWFESKLEIELSGNGFGDISYIYFNNEATQGMEGYWDCIKRPSNPGQPTLYTLIGSERVSLNGQAISELGENSVPLGLAPGANGQFTFEAIGLNTFPLSTMIYLEDKATGTWTNLREQNTYTFNMTTQEAEDRFEIHFTKPIALSHEAETCEQNDATISLDFGNQTIAGNLQSWDYEIQLASQVVASGSEANLAEISDLEPGDYEITLTNGNQVLSEWITIEDKVQVEADFDANATTLFVGDELLLTNVSNGATSYEWEVNGELFTTNDLNYTFTVPGTYVVLLNASNADCDAVTEQSFIVNEKTTGIAEQIELDKVVVYTKGNNILVDLSNADVKGQTDLEVYNAIGQLLIQELDIEVIKEIEMANQARGYYFVNIINQQEQVSRKVILK